MTKCICKSQSQVRTLQPFEDLYFANLSSDQIMVGPVVNSGYERMSNTLSVHPASKISKMAPL